MISRRRIAEQVTMMFGFFALGTFFQGLFPSRALAEIPLVAFCALVVGTTLVGLIGWLIRSRGATTTKGRHGRL